MTSPRARTPRAYPLPALLLAVLLAQPAQGAAPQVFDPTQSDPRAVAIADLVLAAMGGPRAWEQTRFLHFAFAVERRSGRTVFRTHLWDRWEGRLRYQATGKDGTPFVVLLDLESRTGEAYRLSREAPAQGSPRDRAPARFEPEAERLLLTEAYESWINDTYWVLMPYKMKDPGVRLRYAGDVRRDGSDYDLVELTFAGVGLTPGDRYWAHVNRRTHLMDRWSYVLQDDPPGSEPTVWDWKGWTRRGRILLCPEKVTSRKGETVKIVHPILEVYDSLPDAYFNSPEPLPGDMGERAEPLQ
ncbi:MAG TPA: hypothetical protein VGV60_01360 [Candidatus Polarisedimenticolia bacterium]|nr:hypothetical protein [Candidatus Polarisedimenticolia bacterium]